MRPMLLAVIAILVVGSIVYADPYVTATYAPMQTGGYRLDFIVHADLDYKCYKWGLFTSGITSEISDLAAPFGWHAESGLRQTEWSTPLSSVYVVAPFGILYGCSATFSTLPAQLDYYVLTGLNRGNLVPIPVPEPSSVLALLGGMSGLAGFALRRRMR